MPIKKERIGSYLTSHKITGTWCDAQARTLAYREIIDPVTQRMVINGQPQQPFLEVRNFALSPNGKHWAYVARDQVGEVVVVDGGLSRTWFEWISQSPLLWSSDSAQVAYTAKVAKGKYVVVAGEATFGPFSDEQPDAGGAWPAIRFHPKTDEIAYVAIQGECQQVEVSGKPYGPPLRTAMDLAFSDDGSRLVYRGCEREDSWFAVIDGKPAAPYIFVADLKLSTDGRRYIYRAENSRGEFVVFNNQEGEVFKSVSFPRVASHADAWTYRIREPGGGFRVAYNHEKGPLFQGVTAPAISPNGKHVAYEASLDHSNYFLVLDGKRQKEIYQGILDQSINFSSDSQNLTFIARSFGNKGPSTVILNGASSPQWSAIWTLPTFLNSTASVEYIVSVKNDFYWIEQSCSAL